MTRSEIIRKAIQEIPLGRVFSYSELATTQLKHTTLVSEMSRLVKDGVVYRVMRGRFVVSDKNQKTASGIEIINAICRYRNKLCGYETGPSVWEKWGLIPITKNRKEYYVAITQMRPAQTHEGIIIRFKKAKLDPSRYNHEILQFLDTLESINKIPTKSKEKVLPVLFSIFNQWNESKKQQFSNYALAYSPIARVLAGIFLQNTGNNEASKKLAISLHPATTYKINVDCSILKDLNLWRIIEQK